MFSHEKLEGFAERMPMRRFGKVERIRHTNLTARLPKKRFLPTRRMQASITLKEMCVCVCVCFIIIKKIYVDIFPPQDETHLFSHSNTLEARSVHVSVCTRNDVVM